MRKIIRKNPGVTIFVLLLSLIFSMILAVGIGPVTIPFAEVWNVILAKTITGNFESLPNNIVNIVWELRVPRVILGFIVGGGLALSGVGMQAVTRNPLSGPYVLGISSGASVGAVMAILTGFRFFGIFSIPVGAFIGSLVTIFLVYILSGVKEGVVPIKLILTGIAISALFSAFTNFMIFNSKFESGIRNVTFWMMGSLAGSKWIYVTVPFLVLVFSIIVFYLVSNGLNTLLMGENTATTLGINVTKIRNIIIFVTALLTGAIVSVSGSISFVGLVIPHIVRNIMGTDHKLVVPASAIIGGMFLVWADVLARTMAGSSELPIGILTGLVGAPFFIWLVRKSKYSFGD